MKILFGILLCATLISCGQVSAPVDNHNTGNSGHGMSIHLAADSTFSVKNETRINVGGVAVWLVDTTFKNINVPDSGTYTVHIAADPNFCVLHGQNLYYDTPTWITIDAHTRIHADWIDNVVVIDQSEQN